jgi:hypothetical protein
MEKKVKGDGLEYLYYNKELYSIILREKFSSSTIMFFTEDDTPQQLGYLPHKKGDIIKPHIHNPLKREIYNTNELLLVKRGKVKVKFYNQKKEYVGSDIIESGDMIHLSRGGHGFEILEDTVMIEIKQGPYLGVDDKERFTGGAE